MTNRQFQCWRAWLPKHWKELGLEEVKELTAEEATEASMSFWAGLTGIKKKKNDD